MSSMLDSVTRKLLRLALILLVFAVVAGAGRYFRDPIYYPLVVVDVPENLTLTFLQQPTPDRNACVALSSTIASVMRANCPMCKIVKEQCPSELTPELGKLFSERPIDGISARTRNGVVSYAHPDLNIALATCMESQKQAVTSAQKPQLACYPADTPRPYPKNYVQPNSEAKALFNYLAQTIAILGIALALFVAVQILAVRSPTDAVGVASSAEASFKLSNLAKRISDILISVLVLALLFPVFVVISILIFVLEGYPVFYVSRRYISLDQCISILKFRTMVKDATHPRHRLRERYMRDGYLDIPLDCEVYTPIGRFLERTQLVEVLQLINVLVNGMSLIGNRPLPLENINLLKKFSGWEGRFDSPAGLTGLSQIVGKLNQTPEVRLELECLYSAVYKSKSGNIMLCDLFIYYYTVRLLLFGKYLSIEQAKALVARASGTAAAAMH